MAVPKQEAPPLDGFSLADLMVVLRCALHSKDSAAVDASWRILLGLFPLHEMAEEAAGRSARPQRPGRRPAD
jgi:hypothetical protein